MSATSSPLSFQHLSAELRLFCGQDSLAALTRELRRSGCKRAVALCGRTVSGSEAMEKLRDMLGIVLVGECNTVRPNSPLPAVEEAAQALREAGADAVIAIGGGSAAVTARAASILLAEGRPAPELSTRRLPNGEFESPRLNAPKLPQFIVPTTPSTAFVKAGSAIQDPASGDRLALFDPKTRVKALFLHPDFIGTSPVELIQSASLNTLSNAIEALESPKCDPLSEAMLSHAVRLIARELDSVSAEDIASRERLVLAAVLCGRGTEGAGGGLASVLAHAIGHRSQAANGIVNAIVLPHTMRFNAPATQQNSARIMDGLGAGWQSAGTQPIEALEALLGKLPIPRRLRDIGVAQEDLFHIADTALSDWFIGRNPRRVENVGDVLQVLNAAW